MPKPPQGPPKKEAVVFILDSFPTMNEPHPTKSSPADDDNKKRGKDPTRLDCAKRALEGMLADMLLNGEKGSMATVIVTKTKKTENHILPADATADEIDNFPYANLTELRH